MVDYKSILKVLIIILMIGLSSYLFIDSRQLSCDKCTVTLWKLSIICLTYLIIARRFTVQFIGIEFKVMSKDRVIDWLIIIAGIILMVAILGIPKDHCDKCDFDGLNGKKFFESYEKKCLQKYSSFQDNPNLPTLNFSHID
jgi:lipid-A-disaccharide synthase-like uncharacterized protein